MMKCDTGCGECCGPVLCNENEYQAVIGYARNRGIVPIRQGVTCPFYQNGGCSVYEVRPHVCRLFGHTPRLNCCKGYNTNVPEGRLARIERDYLKRGTPGRMLHEAVYSLDEIPDVIFGDSSLRHLKGPQS